MHVRLALSVSFDPPGVRMVRHVLRGLLGSLAVDDRSVQDLAVAVSEACTNVVDHTRVPVYDVTMTVRGSDCIVEVVDDGPGTDGAASDLPADVMQEHGRGLALMRALVDDLIVEARPTGGTVVRLVKGLSYAERGALVAGG